MDHNSSKFGSRLINRNILDRIHRLAYHGIEYVLIDVIVSDRINITTTQQLFKKIYFTTSR